MESDGDAGHAVLGEVVQWAAYQPRKGTVRHRAIIVITIELLSSFGIQRILSYIVLLFSPSGNKHHIVKKSHNSIFLTTPYVPKVHAENIKLYSKFVYYKCYE